MEIGVAIPLYNYMFFSELSTTHIATAYYSVYLQN